MSNDPGHREFDLIVWGASGFTGRLVAEYLRDNYPVGGDLRWAVAGRNPDKLGQILKGLEFKTELPDVLIADSNDPESLDRLARKTRVILTTVGPYAKYGSELLRACAENGTHYCDLAGEAQWIQQMIDRYQLSAEESGARIVNCCGFDSIPSDIGVQFLQNHAVAESGKPCQQVSLVVRAMKGGASGGTFASMMTALEQARSDPQIRRALGNPYSLNPAGERSGPDGSDQSGVEFNELANVWTAPFVMAAINTRVVRRTNALLDYPYGKDFSYRESMATGSGPAGWTRAAVTTAGLGGFVLAASFDFSRKHLVSRLIPKPGEGPTREQRENGYFNMQLFGKTDAGDVFRVRVKGDRDPGYGSTSKMMSECAVCLAKDDLEVGGGLWTPASAMGSHLQKRLSERAGLSFEVE